MSRRNPLSRMSFPLVTHTAESEENTFRISVPVRVIEAIQQRDDRVVQFSGTSFASVSKALVLLRHKISQTPHCS